MMNQNEYIDSSESADREEMIHNFNKENERNSNEGDVHRNRTVAEEYKESGEITNVSKNVIDNKTPYEEIGNITINEKYIEKNNVSQKRNRLNNFITDHEEEETYNINMNSLLNSTINKMRGKKSDILNEILGKGARKKKKRQEDRPNRNQNTNDGPSKVETRIKSMFTCWNGNKSAQPSTAFSIGNSARVNTTTPTNASNRQQSILPTHCDPHENNTTSIRLPASLGIHKNLSRDRVDQGPEDGEGDSDGSSSSSSDMGRHNASNGANHAHPFPSAHNSRNDKSEHAQCENQINEMLKERIHHFLNKVKTHVRSYKDTSNFLKFMEEMQKTLFTAIQEVTMIHDVSLPIFETKDSSGVDVTDILYYNSIDKQSSHNLLMNFMTTQNVKHMERMYDQIHYDKLFIQTVRDLVFNLNEILTNKDKMERFTMLLDEKSIREYEDYFSTKFSEHKKCFENIANEYVNAYDRAADVFNEHFVLNVSLLINNSFKDILSSMIYDKNISSYGIKTPLGEAPSVYQFIRHIGLFLQSIFNFFDNFIQNLYTFTNVHIDEVVRCIDSFSNFYERRSCIAHMTTDFNLFFKKTNQNNYNFMWKNKQNDHELQNHILHYSSSCIDDVQLKEKHNKKKSKHKNKRMEHEENLSMHKCKDATQDTTQEHAEYERSELPMNFMEGEDSFDVQELKFPNEQHTTHGTHIFGGSERKRKAAPEHENKTLNDYNKDTETKELDVLKESFTYDLLENFKSKLKFPPSFSSFMSSEQKEVPAKKKIRFSNNLTPKDHECKDSFVNTSTSNVDHNKCKDSLRPLSRSVPSDDKSNSVFCLMMSDEQEQVSTQAHPTTNPVQKSQSSRTRKLYPNKKYNRLSGTNDIQTTNQNNSSVIKNRNNEDSKGNNILSHGTASYARSSHPVPSTRNQEQGTSQLIEYLTCPYFFTYMKDHLN